MRYIWMNAYCGFPVKAYFVNLYDATQWMLSFANWKTVAANLFNAITSWYLLTLLSLLTLVSLLIYRRKLRQQIIAWSSKVSRYSPAVFPATFLSFVFPCGCM